MREENREKNKEEKGGGRGKKHKLERFKGGGRIERKTEKKKEGVERGKKKYIQT